MEDDEPVGPNDPPGPHVLVMSPDAFSSVALPTAGSLNVGRSSKCLIRIEDPLASREHARLHVNMADGALSLRIEDLGSANARPFDPPPPPDRPPPDRPSPSSPGLAAAELPVLDDPIKAVERQRILDALANHAGNQTRAAEALGMPRRTFITKLDAYGIPRPQKSPSGRF
jgi:DNA-binding NtrC family response regulator